MGKLKVLNLHDNGIVRIDDVHALAICKSLVALTLYDTPLSLKPNYRFESPKILVFACSSIIFELAKSFLFYQVFATKNAD